MSFTVQTLKADLAAARALALEGHRRAEDPFNVVLGLSAGIDEILCRLFREIAGGDPDHVALVSVGGYGRRELCPQSDLDLLFLREKGHEAESVEKLVRFLWDGGVQLGHAVRTPEECYEFMQGDIVTANTLLESRFLAGSERLHAAFLAKAVNRYRRHRAKAFLAAKLELLRQSIEDPQRTIYVVEPNVKEGTCGLRDVQRVLWIENMKHRQSVDLDSILRSGPFSGQTARQIREAYAFYLRLRCELHFTNNVKQDILERLSALKIARNLGYGKDRDDQGGIEELMGDYYRHARNVYRSLRYYLETSAGGSSLGRLLSRRFGSEKVRPCLSLHKGRLYWAGPPPGDLPVEEILDIFKAAQEKEAVLSEVICEWIRSRASRLDEDAMYSAQVLAMFRSILKDGRGVGRLLKTLHETGILGRILPEFGRLDCLVNFDGHHQFTVDEHTLKTLEEVDRLERDPSYPEQELRRIFLEIKDHLPLRLALLVHDTGKSLPGMHAVSGTEAATLICERLGLGEKVIQTVAFLVYRHLELFRVSQLRDFTEASVIESLAKLVENEERLKMLYLMTYLDIVSVGPGTWTHWKGAQLWEVYQRTLIHLRTGAHGGENLDVILAASALDEPQQALVLEHCKKMETPGYSREILPERMLYHVTLAEEFRKKGEMQVARESFAGYDDVTFCGADRPRLFADLTGLLFSEGFNVLGARIYSRSDGVVIDLFQVEVADTVQLGVGERVERIRKKLRKVEARTQMVEDFIRQRTSSYRSTRWRKPLFGPSVSFDNESSPACSVIEVSAGDRPGLLYDLAHALHQLGLDVRTAKISTFTDRARDAFYVVEKDGGKVDNPARKSEILQYLVAQAQNPAGALTLKG